MVFLDLAELDNVYDVLAALREMSAAEMKCIVLGRLYIWHASNADADEWLKPSCEVSSSKGCGWSGRPAILGMDAQSPHPRRRPEGSRRIPRRTKRPLVLFRRAGASSPSKAGRIAPASHKGREIVRLRLDEGHDRLGTNTVVLHRLRRLVGLQSRLEGGEVWDLEDQPDPV